MRKYFILEITTTEAGTAKAITEVSTLDNAKMLFHQIMASAYANNDVTYALAQIIDDRGFCLITELKPANYGQEEE